ncbi:alpha/beta fold hydrolase [Pseudalkalibacillus caeni]|uniref:Alpha/beta fold hydrolase n=1 Tax=Exobacillus caeni TaxID=2574798 RepID=A0A5R9F286_9BACL|nr:alpha/beta fold hydrolase [Pseudalkalibacillus caeni]TLS35598.1 alpha/beta fold hydrolase [Pseudalkalibacillus caeni]
MYATVNGIKLFFDIDGAGYVKDNEVLKKKPVCFVLHGGPGGTHGNFKPYLNELTKTMQLVYIDNRGSGFSEEASPETYTLENNVEDIEALRDYLGLETIWLLGHSYGGMVAMSYALRYEENLEGLILVTTSPSYRFIEKAKRYVEENGTPEQKEMASVLWEGKFESTEQLNRYYEVMEPLYSVTATSATESNPVQVQPDVKRSYQALNNGFGGFLREFDLINDLTGIFVPTLVIAGRHDWITPVEENELIHQQLKDSQFIVLENSSHSVFKDEREVVLEHITEFVKENKFS